MTLQLLTVFLVGVGLGIMGTLTYLAVLRWQRPRRLEYDATLERLRRL